MISAETLRQLGDAAGVSIWIWQALDDHVYHAASGRDGAGLAQGVSLAETLARIHPADRARVRRRLRSVERTGKIGTVRFRNAPSAGRTRHFIATCFLAAPGRVQVVLRDETRAVEAEMALRESEDHYRNAVNLSPEIPWLADPDGNIVEFGPRWLELVGLTAGQTLGQGWAKALHPDDLRPTMAAWQASLASGEPVDVEYRVRLRSGEYRWMRARASARRDAAGRILRWYGTLGDIHERKLAVAALHESEGFARSILESSTTAIEVLDAEGRLIFINGPGLRAMAVDSFQHISGRPYDSFWPEEAAPAVRNAIEEAQRGGSLRQTLYGPTARGEPRWWDITVSPILDAKGRVARLLAQSRDVTEEKRNEAEVVAASKRLANVLECTMDSVISLDRNWRIIYMNHRALAVFGSTGPFIGRDVRDLFDGTESEPFFVRYRQAMAEQRSIAFEDYLPSARSWFEIQAYGNAEGLIIFFRDVTARRLAQEQIAHLARHDALTGLPNRMHFRERLEGALSALSGQHALAVLSVDLDDFKLVNDTLGHPAGDALLREVAARLHGCAGPHGFVARFGGDEFALLLPLERPEDAAVAAQAILASIGAPFEIDGEAVNVGASVGISIAPRNGTEAEAMLQNADVALYRVKGERGRNFRFFEPAMDHALRERREMKRELGLALQRKELSVVFQPQIQIANNRLTGFEALVRWNSRTHGLVSPEVFIPLAEENGLIEEIGAFVLEQACAEAVRWPEHISIAVNLSPAQFRSHAVYKSVAAALAKTGLPASRLELEITESVLLDEGSGAIRALEELHKAGIRVALDDFGTGYSSLSYLRRFPFDKIKIDRSFVGDLPDADGSVAIVRAILGLGRSLKTKVTAEGVETWEQLLMLRDEGCDEAQGYLFSQPLPAAQARVLACAHDGGAHRQSVEALSVASRRSQGTNS